MVPKFCRCLNSAIILAEDVVVLDGVPAISDVDSLIDIMERWGQTVKRDGETLEIDPRGVQDMPMPYGKSIVCVHPIFLRISFRPLWESSRWFTWWMRSRSTSD